MAGGVIGERFVLERQVGAGGMGVVFRALDRSTGEPVAVKLCMSGGGGDADRFDREARLLAGLEHPNVVRYVDHGILDDGSRYLAMEWIDGEDLAERLSREPLPLGEAARLGAALAGALASAHDAGLVHRDVKPANVLLRGGRTDRPCLADFGVAHAAGAVTLTRTGALVGTPGYMAPEQAGAGGRVGPQTDLFALGCVLYECVSGRPAFSAETVAATLAKILFAPTPALQLDSSDAASASFARLVQRLLEKDITDRPRSAREVASELTSLASAPLVASSTPSIGTRELMVTSLWLATAADVEHARTIEADTGQSSDASGSSGLARAAGADIVTLADGTLLGTVRRGAARDQARAVVRSALALRALRPELSVVVATGRAATGHDVPMGDAIDRAAAMLRLRPLPSGVRADDATAELVGESFDVSGDENGLVISARATPVHADRTKCVGRARELGYLQSLIAEADEEAVVRVVLVTGAAGVGKSRMRRELVKQLGNERTVLSAFCDPLTADVPFQLAAGLVRSRAAHAGPDVDLGAIGTLPPEERTEIGATLRGMLALAEGGGSPGARMESFDESRLLAAYVRWLRAELHLGPLVVLLEDVQWGDAASIGLLERAAKLDGALTIIAFARPEVTERFPEMFAACDPTHLRLGPLTQRAASELARSLIGDDDPEAVATLVSRSQGHPMLLEELARAFRESGLERAHGTLEALLESRLLLLDGYDRRVLRAASIFGVHFPESGVAALLEVRTVGAALERAMAAELVTEAHASPVLGRQLAFAHAMIRDASYATLPDQDRRRGHRVAADWLEAAGESNPAVLAEHWIRCASTDDERCRALEMVMAVCERTSSRDAYTWLSRAESIVASLEALGSRAQAEIDLVGGRAKLAMRSSRPDALRATERWLEAARAADAKPALVRALAQLCVLTADQKGAEAARPLLAEAKELAGLLNDPTLRAALASTDSLILYYLDDLAGSAGAALRAAEASAEAGLWRSEAIALHNAADATIRLGNFEEALELLDKSTSVVADGRLLSVLHNDVLVTFIRAMRDGAAWRDDLERARARFEDGLEHWNALEVRLYQAMLEAWRGDPARSAHLFEALEQASREHGHSRLAEEALECRVAVIRGELPWFRAGRRPPTTTPLGS